MQRAVLIFNPVSGQRPARRMTQVEAAAAALRAAGVEASLLATAGVGTAGRLAADAIAAGADTVFACGGDGTVHEVLQGMIGREAALGVIPLGTANSLACDLGVPREPALAARAANEAVPQSIAVGRVSFQTASGPAWRWFIMNVGVGMDALLFYRLNALAKRRFGMAAYYTEAFRQWAIARYQYFDCAFTLPEGQTRRERVTQAMAVRIADFGGLVGRLAPGADLRKSHLRLLLFRTARRSHYLRFTLRTAFNRHQWNVPGVELADAVAVRCEPVPDAPGRIYVEADGELLGTAPAELAMAEERIMLLMPRRR